MIIPRLQMKARSHDGGEAGPVSRVARVVGRLAEVATSVPGLAPAATVTAHAAKVVADLAGYFGYTRENEEPPLDPVFLRGLHNTSKVDGTDIGEVVALVGDGLIAPDSTLLGVGAEEDLLSFPSLFARPTLVGIHSIGVTTPVGFEFYRIPVMPGYHLTSTPYDATTYCLSTPGFVGLPFANWRGDMVYHIQIVGATVHSGQVQFYWAPDDTAFAGNVTNVLNNIIIDVTDTSEHVFRVGYASLSPYLPNEYWRAGMTVPPLGGNNGFLKARLLTPLQTQDSTNFVYILTWMSGGENLDFRVMRDNVNFPTSSTVVVPMSIQGQLRLQMRRKEALGAEPSTQAISHHINGDTGSYPVDAINYPGSGVRSARAMAQKPCRLLLAGTLNVLPMVDHSAFDGSSSGWTWLSYYTSLFIGAAYSSHYQVVPGSDSLVTVSVATSTTDDPRSGAAQIVPKTGSASYVLPYASHLRFMPTRPVGWDPKGWNRIQVQSLNAEAVAPSVWRSAGKDLRVGVFTGVPGFKVITP